jgi:hypothetical protein
LVEWLHLPNLCQMPDIQGLQSEDQIAAVTRNCHLAGVAKTETLGGRFCLKCVAAFASQGWLLGAGAPVITETRKALRTPAHRTQLRKVLDQPAAFSAEAAKSGQRTEAQPMTTN